MHQLSTCRSTLNSGARTRSRHDDLLGAPSVASPERAHKPDVSLVQSKYERSLRALEEFHRDRYGRIREGLYKLFEGFSEDQVLETMKDDPDTAHFALKRMVEIVDQQWAAERELQIEKLLNEVTILNQGHELRLT